MAAAVANAHMGAGSNAADMHPDANVGVRRCRYRRDRKGARGREAQRQKQFSHVCHFRFLFSN
jgi:hypothetical protein